MGLVDDVTIQRLKQLANTLIAPHIRGVVFTDFYAPKVARLMKRVQLEMLRDRGVLYEWATGERGIAKSTPLTPGEIYKLQSWHTPSDLVYNELFKALEPFIGIEKWTSNEELRNIILHKDLKGRLTSIAIDTDIVPMQHGLGGLNAYPFRLMAAHHFARLDATDGLQGLCSRLTTVSFNIPNGTWYYAGSGHSPSYAVLNFVAFLRGCRQLETLEVCQSRFFGKSSLESEEAADLRDLLELLSAESWPLTKLMISPSKIEAGPVLAVLKKFREQLVRVRLVAIAVLGNSNSWIDLLSTINGMPRLEGAHIVLNRESGCIVGGPVDDSIVGHKGGLRAQIARGIQKLQMSETPDKPHKSLGDMRRMMDDTPQRYSLLPGEEVDDRVDTQTAHARRKCYNAWAEKKWAL